LDHHFPSCDTLVAATGPEVYCFDLDPLLSQGDWNEDISSVNYIEINSMHQLLAYDLCKHDRDTSQTLTCIVSQGRTRFSILQRQTAFILFITVSRSSDLRAEVHHIYFLRTFLPGKQHFVIDLVICLCDVGRRPDRDIF
jgi:hypothetical protein